MCFKLIDAYEQNFVLWDPKNSFYFSKIKKNGAWDNIIQKMEINLDPEEI